MSLFSPTTDGARFTVKLTPKASRNSIGDVMADAHGALLLKCSVTAIPENGKANQALVKMLSKTWKIPRKNIEIVAGATDRLKTLEMKIPPEKISFLSKMFPL